MGQFMAESPVLAGLVQLGVNGYSHLPFASAVSQSGKTRIRRRQYLEIYADSITDCRVLDRALQPIWFPLTLIACEVLQLFRQILTLGLVQSIDQHHGMHWSENQHRTSIFS